MEDLTAQMRLLRYYRETEVRGAELLQRLLRKTEDPELQITLTRQLADEARHIQLWTELIGELGGTPTAFRKGYRQRLHRDVGIPSTELGLLALTLVIEERIQQRYREHAARRGEDPRIVALLRTLIVDEDWHLAGVKDCLVRQEKKEGRTRVAATLDHYRDAEANAFAKLVSEEDPT
jgi:rubrerythrin